MNKKGNVIVMVLIVIALILLVAGSYYAYTLSQKDSTTDKITDQTPVSAGDDNLSQELNSIQIEDTDDSFSLVDQELKSL